MSVRVCLAASALFLAGCTSGDGSAGSTVDEPDEPGSVSDPLDGLYAIDRVVSVDIELDAQTDFSELRADALKPVTHT